MKVAINACFGGFSLSNAAIIRLIEKNSGVLKQEWVGYHSGLKREEMEGQVRKYTEACEEYSLVVGVNSANNSQYFAPYRFGTGSIMYRDAIYSLPTVFGDDLVTLRTSPDLIAVIEEMGEAANGACAKLKVVEVPDGVPIEIDEYDGNESVAEKHRVWR